MNAQQGRFVSMDSYEQTSDPFRKEHLHEPTLFSKKKQFSSK